MYKVSLFKRLLIPFVFGFYSIQCKVYNPSHAEFWTESLALQLAMEKKFKGTNVVAILQGMLNPEDEDLLYPIDDNKLYLALEGYKRQNSWILQTVRQSSPNPSYAMKTIYTKDYFGEDEIYKVQRFQEGTMGNARPSVTFNGIAALIQNGPEGTKTQEFLCRVFECEVQTTNTLTYKFTQKTKTIYPAFYQKFFRRLNSMEFTCKGIPDGNQEASIVVSNQKEKIIIQLPPNEFSKSWVNPNTILLTLNIKIWGYGLTLKVQNLVYVLKFKKSNSIETLSGSFRGVPESKIEGRFFYVIPQGLINLFIPNNIETYLKNGIQLLTIGSSGLKGTEFTTVYGGEGKNSYYRYSGYSETYRKKFSLLGQRKLEEEEGTGNQKVFFHDFFSAIIEDLRTIPYL